MGNLLANSKTLDLGTLGFGVTATANQVSKPHPGKKT